MRSYVLDSRKNSRCMHYSLGFDLRINIITDPYMYVYMHIILRLRNHDDVSPIIASDGFGRY